MEQKQLTLGKIVLIIVALCVGAVAISIILAITSEVVISAVMMAKYTSVPPHFSIKGATMLKADMGDEIWHYICYKVDVYEFLFSEEPDMAELIGDEEQFEYYYDPIDKLPLYCSTYYEQLDSERGLMVKKVFMPCGPEIELEAGVETPIFIKFYPRAGADSGIIDFYSQASSGVPHLTTPTREGWPPNSLATRNTDKIIP